MKINWQSHQLIGELLVRALALAWAPACVGGRASTISSIISFLRRNGGVQGGLYWFSAGAPTLRIPCSSSVSSSFCCIRATFGPVAQPEKRTTATVLAGTVTISMRSSSGIGNSSNAYSEGIVNAMTGFPPARVSCTGAVMAIDWERSFPPNI